MGVFVKREGGLGGKKWGRGKRGEGREEGEEGGGDEWGRGRRGEVKRGGRGNK